MKQKHFKPLLLLLFGFIFNPFSSKSGLTRMATLGFMLSVMPAAMTACNSRSDSTLMMMPAATAQAISFSDFPGPEKLMLIGSMPVSSAMVTPSRAKRRQILTAVGGTGPGETSSPT